MICILEHNCFKKCGEKLAQLQLYFLTELSGFSKYQKKSVIQQNCIKRKCTLK